MSAAIALKSAASVMGLLASLSSKRVLSLTASAVYELPEMLPLVIVGFAVGFLVTVVSAPGMADPHAPLARLLTVTLAAVIDVTPDGVAKDWRISKAGLPDDDTNPSGAPVEFAVLLQVPLVIVGVAPYEGAVETLGRMLAAE